jgi:hypothetical protein
MNSPDKNVNEICEEFVSRSHKGFVKYGTTTHDRTDLELADWIQHLKEELMDSIVYIHKIQKVLESSKQIIDIGEAIDKEIFDARKNSE